jgi:hypothetical protein
MELLVISLTLDLQEAHESLRINDIYIYIYIYIYIFCVGNKRRNIT